MIFKCGWVRRDVGVIMLLLSIFQPFSFAFAMENPCQQAAIDRYNASQKLLDTAFDAAAKWPNDKYDTNESSCNSLLALTLVGIGMTWGPAQGNRTLAA